MKRHHNSIISIIIIVKLCDFFVGGARQSPLSFSTRVFFATAPEAPPPVAAAPPSARSSPVAPPPASPLTDGLMWSYLQTKTQEVMSLLTEAMCWLLCGRRFVPAAPPVGANSSLIEATHGGRLTAAQVVREQTEVTLTTHAVEEVPTTHTHTPLATPLLVRGKN